MLCPVCLKRWAPISRENYAIDEKSGIFVKNEKADQKIIETLMSDESNLCGSPECEDRISKSLFEPSIPYLKVVQ